MSMKQNIRATIAIWKIALQAGKTAAEVRRDMQEAIDFAWATTDPVIKEEQLCRFPEGKPSIEHFVAQLAGEIKN